MGTRTLPSGTVTFLFTDVEGSTKLLHALGADAYAAALAEHRRTLRDAFMRHGGVEVDTQGDAFLVAFPTAPGALAAARQATDALSEGPIRVRIGLHTGTPLLTDEGYVGADVHRAARIAAAGHGGQVLVSSATAALLDRSAVRDLGEHRLKDLSAPERIYQADPDEHPPLATLHQANLPLPVTPFFGRDAEMAELTALLTREEVRLVTLTGPGGTGKTRLALEAAAGQVERQRDGVVFVDLAPVRDPRLMLGVIASGLGIREVAGEELETTLAQSLRDRDMLVVLDNLEQLLPRGAVLVADLLAAAPGLRLVATSRGPLHLRAEHELPVPSLAWSAPDAEDGRAPAVRLFLDRAAAVGVQVSIDDTTEPLIVEICQRLDGLPLAIELAAARLRVFGLHDLHARLSRRLPILAHGERDLPERQQTLRATIAWSDELLAPAHRSALARLGVFLDSFGLDDAEAVLSPASDDGPAVAVEILLDHSLLRVARGDAQVNRYRMLETVREYALERLDEIGEADDARGRHAAHVARIVHAHAPRLRTSEMSQALIALEAIHRDGRAALDFLLAAADTDAAARLFVDLANFWMALHRWSEGAAYARTVAEVVTGTTSAAAWAVHYAGTLAWMVGDLGAARDRWERALALQRELGDRRGMAGSLNNLAMLEEDQRTARELFRESHALHLEAGGADPSVLVNIAESSIAVGDMDEAVRFAALGHDAATAAGDYTRLAASLQTLAWASFVTSQPEASRRWYLEAIRASEEAAMVMQRAAALGGLAWVAARHGDPDAASVLGDALALVDPEEPWAWVPLLLLVPAAVDLAAAGGDLAAASELRNALADIIASHPNPRSGWIRELAGVTGEPPSAPMHASEIVALARRVLAGR